MPVKQDSINRELYGMLKSRGYRPDMFTSSGKKVSIPDEAEAFQFDFIKDGENYGKVTVTVDGLHRLIIYYGDEVENSPKADSHDSESFNSLRKHLKRFAKNKQLGFELSDIDDLEPDMAKREHNQKDKLAEGYYAMGKTKSYSDNVPSTKIVIQHSRQIEEGEQRYRNVAKIFVENANGERFLLPTTKPGIARVYARHVAEGGTPYDERGTHITSLVEEYNKMAGFVRATKNKEFNESVQRLISEGVNHYSNLRETLHRMAGKRGYNEYFENYTPALMEDEEHVDLSEMFRQSSLDPRIESVMPILGKLSKNINETSEMVETLALESWVDEVTSIKIDEAQHDDDEDDGLIAGRYTPEQWAKMVAIVKKKAQEQDAKKQQNQPSELGEDDVDESGLGDMRDFFKTQAPLQTPIQTPSATTPVARVARQNEEVDMGQYDAVKSTPKSKKDDDKEFKAFREKLRKYGEELEQRQKEKGVSEDLDSNQKSAGQLGPTEKVKNNNIGKLVGANESVDPVLTDIKRLSGL